ncbi:MAG: DUF2125 domain-containing protein [Kiloniellaceae bacterium]
MILAAGLLVLLLGGGGLGLYWLWAADQVAAAVERWTLEQRARGYDVRYGGPRIGGFPVRLTVRFTEPRVVSPRGWRWSGREIGGEAAFWAPRTLRLDLPRKQVIAAAWRGHSRRVAVDAEAARGLVRLAPNGRVRTATVEMRDLTLRGESGWTAHAARVRADLAARPAPIQGTEDGTLALAGEATGVTVPDAAGGPFGATIERLAVEIRVIGAIPSGEAAQALAQWRDRGGLLEVDELDLRWGPLEVKAEGSGGLDEALRPQGAFDARIRGLPETIDALAARGLIKAGGALAIKMTVLALSRTEDGDARPVIALPVTLRNGLMYLGPVALFSVGPVL